MGKPRLILLIRHAQSEGNKNRDIHQTIPDHRVKLTPDGWKQAEEAGHKLRSLLRPSDTLQFYTSPYLRTRETTEGILRALTSDHPAPSPFPRHTIKVYEEPRLREQDFGNFQPSSVEMSRMWRERAAYGHFFYRIPNGESAADAYDRVAGFNESLWRGFGDEEFASVCVLVTHGLMTRVFLMKWYHFSVEYFEDLRNVNHCEFIVMKRDEGSGKYVLQNQLRTWSELREEKELEMRRSPIPVRKRWGDGRDEEDGLMRRRPGRQNTADLFLDDGEGVVNGKEKEVGERAQMEGVPNEDGQGATESYDQLVQDDEKPTLGRKRSSKNRILSSNRLAILQAGRDGGGSRSGTTSQMGSSDEDTEQEVRTKPRPPRSLALALSGAWDTEQGLRSGRRADALGDQSDLEDEMQKLEEQEIEDKSFEGSVH